MTELEIFKKEVIRLLLEAKDKKGEQLFNEESAAKHLEQLRDEELEEGLLFNTPQDVADVLLEEL